MASNAKELNGNNGEENSFKVVFRWKHISSKFNQDVPIFFDSGYRLKSEWLFTKVWGIENEPKPYPLLMVYSTTNWSKPNSNPFVVSLGILNSDGKSCERRKEADIILHSSLVSKASKGISV